jgi:hypothetical protein
VFLTIDIAIISATRKSVYVWSSVNPAGAIRKVCVWKANKKWLAEKIWYCADFCTVILIRL